MVIREKSKSSSYSEIGSSPLAWSIRRKRCLLQDVTTDKLISCSLVANNLQHVEELIKLSSFEAERKKRDLGEEF